MSLFSLSVNIIHKFQIRSEVIQCVIHYLVNAVQKCTYKPRHIHKTIQSHTPLPYNSFKRNTLYIILFSDVRKEFKSRREQMSFDLLQTAAYCTFNCWKLVQHSLQLYAYESIRGSSEYWEQTLSQIFRRDILRKIFFLVKRSKSKSQ